MTTEQPSDQKIWAIIRYAPHSGTFPEADAAAFDGWYTDKQDALAVAQDWVERHPQWTVGLVQSELIWFGNGDFTSLRNRPLTIREKNLLLGRLASGAATD